VEASRFWRRDWVRRPLFWLGVLTVVLVALAACQPVEQAEGVQVASPEPTQSATVQSEDTGAKPAPGGDYSVGFTPDGDPYKGNLEAPVIIEEFSSFQCPFCGRYFQESYPSVMSRYVETGQVLYIYKDFPLSGQPQSPKAAEAARCAGDVAGADAFWEMHDRLFEGQGEWSGRSNAVDIFKNYAVELGISPGSFNDCLDSGRTADQVEAAANEGMTRGVRGTPTFFIDGQPLVGAQPVSAFAAAIDAALAGEPIEPAAAGAGETSEGAAQPPPDVVVPTPAAFDLEGSGARVFALGDPDAPVTIVEFSDYQCPVCATYFQQTWPAMKEQYIDTGRVYYVYKDFPLLSIHPQAAKAAEAARCAAEVGGEEIYWEMHDKLYSGQSAWSGNVDHAAIFKEYAGELGLDQDAFDACLDSSEQAAVVQANMDEGFSYGVNGTPTFFIGGYPFSGAHPIQNFEQIITLAENDQLQQAIAEAIAQAQQQQQQQAQPRPTMAPADVPLGDAPVKGDPDAPVTIVEYSDYQCPFCERHFNETLPGLTQNYIDTGKVRYVFKDFPLSQIHPQAAKAAEAARCVGEAGGDELYWEMHDLLFEGQAAWSGNPAAAAIFKTYAGELGLDQAAFDACLDSGRYAAAVQSDLTEGAGFGVSGTPAFFINGQPLSGAQPYQVFEQVIETMLAGE
jgi:protein-disulfide isomerase